MYVVFVEYMVFHQCKQAYLEYMYIFNQKNPIMELLESADQDGLFVEIWREISEEAYLRMKQERLEEKHPSHSPAVYQMIDERKNRLRMWKFNQTYTNES